MKPAASPTSPTGCCVLSWDDELCLRKLHEAVLDGAAIEAVELHHLLEASPADVAGPLDRLRAAGLVEVDDQGRVEPTEHGTNHGREAVRRHRLLETFLHEVLGVSWDRAHEDAELIEHGLSRRVEDLIGEALDHGGCRTVLEPARSRADDLRGEPLGSVGPGSRFRLHHVRGCDTDAIRTLSALGIHPGAELEILEESSAPGACAVRHEQRIHVLDRDVVRVLRGEVVGSARSSA